MDTRKPAVETDSPDARPSGRRIGRPSSCADVFVAIDFETASHERNSACAVGLVRVEEGRVVDRRYRLIRPPSPNFVFTYIHGITWEHVASEPEFPAVWDDVAPILCGARFLVAHNASFDQGVLQACCAHHHVPVPELPFVCTVQLARRTWTLPDAKLPTVCRHLGIRLNHHEALSDAEACANVLLAARRSGVAV
jgi:DNA polymerase III subunit epsilon